MATEKQTTKQKRLFVETVYGRMVDLTTGIEYTAAPKEVIRLNGWLQVQIEAGKMKLVERD